MSENNYQGRRAAAPEPERKTRPPRQKARRTETRARHRVGAVIGVIALVIAAAAAVVIAVVLLFRSGVFGESSGNSAVAAIQRLFGGTDAADEDAMGDATDPALVGVWVYDASASYAFDAKGGGALSLSDTEYAYAYRVDGDLLYLDFEDEQLTDAAYTYTVSGDSLTLVGGDGTAGGTYELTRE